VVRLVVWRPPEEPAAAELSVIKAVRRAELFVFLRLHRHELFGEDLQAELAQACVDSPKGQPPAAPARLALAAVLRACTEASGDEVIEAAVTDRRWQLVLDCMGAGEPPFSRGTLAGFGKRLIGKDLDRRLAERTAELAAAAGGSGARALRAALDSSPVRGAGRVEDTFNWTGHALRKALGVIAVLQGRGQAAGTAVVAAQAGVPQLAACSLKAALDLDRDDPVARDHALTEVLGLADRVEAFVAGQAGDQGAAAAVRTARQVRDQDIGLTGRAPALRRGVAEDRRISVGDAQMRHGRKSRSVLSGGYKRHVLRDPDTGLVPAAGITAADVPQAAVTDDIAAGLQAAGRDLAELHTGRACLASALVRDRSPDPAIYCQAWRVRNTGGRFAKDQFALGFAAGQLTCPAGTAMPSEPGKTARFPARTRAACPPRAQCTTSSHRRSVSIHPGETLLAELRRRQHTQDRRAKPRERAAAGHTLTHAGHWQGRRARYPGTPKNLSGLRRVAVVHNLHVIARQPATDSYQQAS
jgi:Transposase DDE domain